MKNLLGNKTNLILISLVILLLAGGFFAYQKFVVQGASQQVAEEVDLPFDAEGPYALLLPRRDGNALVLRIKRTASYDNISYELAYTSEGIDRGVMGTIKTDDRKGEYEQEILFGTCSKNVCKYDKDVENGTLTLHIRKGNLAYRMVTQWHLQKPDVALGVLASGDGHLTYKLSSSAGDLSLLKFTIINDLSGAPKLPDGKVVVGKVYGINTPEAKSLYPGAVSIEQAEAPSQDSKIARFDEGKNGWVEYETKIDGSKLSALSDGGGVFAVLTPRE
ncbi:hypothetical protein A3A14_04470 [Candidatus Daviesbacteria bacterium RIFCSPLOWO2_01_FULL_43_38]|uniref:Uncharacterized protein n=3 Tax=Candidatus Daviesiibacteriota TaxID=1752718 RepID=A0A1F5K084_9BACT|nr:MAG: hypothetical protein UV33_C0020G0002 [Candidatus Daviesbacteria bacterium GW2011_GWA1_42_6]KKS70623.1 MAG: hypothetical protein UV41_C0018G0016 [Candidatus Daviesbacteria bacterium GW2011_GWA2_42_7]OGE34276.1 MAG: hypothetical protein A3E45_04815 [Candidatus Daviesbacteria bacterium RIFCSPHIGHO2_12_FULL_43_11]OGE63786.1 MAG: hypothetical protein A3A14_04470 [Candidatus Daviesbacteria bacterium RIFCSPLOWO2_01_FULL_43_38]